MSTNDNPDRQAMADRAMRAIAADPGSLDELRRRLESDDVVEHGMLEYDGPFLPGPPPWDQATTDRLNAQQHSGRVHPFTCGNRKDIEKTHADGEGVLVATRGGWVCPWCDYTQS